MGGFKVKMIHFGQYLKNWPQLDVLMIPSGPGCVLQVVYAISLYAKGFGWIFGAC